MSNLYLKAVLDRWKQSQCPSSVAPLQGVFLQKCTLPGFYLLMGLEDAQRIQMATPRQRFSLMNHT